MSMGGRDAITYGSVLALLFTFTLLFASLYMAFSPSTSMKEFLDANLMDSLDGDIRAYDQGDEIIITDAIQEVTYRDGFTHIDLVSIHGTQYDTWEALSLQGDLTGRYDVGARVEITLRIGTAGEGREVFMPIEPEDVMIVSGGA